MKALSLPGNDEIRGIGEWRRRCWPGPRSRGPLRRPCLKVRWGETILRGAQGCYDNDDCQRNGGSLQQCGSLSLLRVGLAKGINYSAYFFNARNCMGSPTRPPSTTPSRLLLDERR